MDPAFDIEPDVAAFRMRLGDTIETQRQELERRWDMLKHLEPGMRAATDMAWPGLRWRYVLDVGMWDGWPDYKPTPSFELLEPDNRKVWWHWAMLLGVKTRGRR